MPIPRCSQAAGHGVPGKTHNCPRVGLGGSGAPGWITQVDDSLKLFRLHYTNCLFKKKKNRKKQRQIFVEHLSIDIIIIVASLFGFTSEFYGARTNMRQDQERARARECGHKNGIGSGRGSGSGSVSHLDDGKNKNATSVLFAQN